MVFLIKILRGVLIYYMTVYDTKDQVLHKQIKALADERGMKIYRIVEQALNELLEREKNKTKTMEGKLKHE